MKFGATIFLRIVLVLFGLGVLAFLLVEPHFEGRNARATFLEIYLGDPFLAYVYAGSIPFFIALWHAWKVLGYAGSNREISPTALRSVRTIKRCAMATIVFVAGALIFIFLHESDDRAGGVVICLAILFASIVGATVAALLERALQKAVAMKSEIDLTV
jgi:hypothetical protein